MMSKKKGLKRHLISDHVGKIMITTSTNQDKANKKNALKSTGPKTSSGKAISKYNALKHGLLSKEILLEDENAEDLTALGRKLRTELVPETELELVLVDRITANVWRLSRVMRIEREMIESDRTGAFGDKTLGGALSADFSNSDTYGKLIRYETSIERGMYKALHELQRLQARRNGEMTSPPTAIDVDFSGDK